MIRSASEFARLRTSGDAGEQHRATVEEAPLEVWMEVIEKHPDLKGWAAHNKTIPHEVLEVLAVDPEARIRASVAEKRKLKPETQALLAVDIDPEVRLRLAYNARCTTEVLRKLAGDKVLRVREVAERKLRERQDAL